ncbi:holin [Nocardioides sp.]|uniref:holin n=1 Tax=Nocardioides sp. TaxID=35761 RepID=UPI003568E2F9
MSKPHSIFTRAFWKEATERAIKSAAQGAIVAGAGAAGFDALSADWRTLGGAALGMGLASLLTSVASDAYTGGGGPNLARTEQLGR